jgi:hypothetical protein
MLDPILNVFNKTTSNTSFDAILDEKSRILILVDLRKIQSIFKGSIASFPKLFL